MAVAGNESHPRDLNVKTGRGNIQVLTPAFLRGAVGDAGSDLLAYIPWSAPIVQNVCLLRTYLSLLSNPL